MKPPKRRHRFTIDLHADNLKGIAHALGEIRHRVREAIHSDHPITTVATGGYGNGWHLEHVEDESVTPESYEAALNEWLEQDRKEADNG